MKSSLKQAVTFTLNFSTSHALDSMNSSTKARKMQFSILHLAQNLGPSLPSLILRQFVDLKIDLSRIERETTRKIRVNIITKINWLRANLAQFNKTSILNLRRNSSKS